MSPTVAQAQEIVDREWGSAIDRLSSTDADRWSTPTRLSEWDVRDLARHAVWGVSMEADAVRRLRLAEDGRADGRHPAEDETTDKILDGLRQAVSELTGELAALGPADPVRLVPMPYGDLPLGVVLDVFVMEAGVHTSDLLHALGEDRPFAADVAASTTAFLTTFLPTLAAMSQDEPPEGASFALIGDSVRLGGRWANGTLVVDADAGMGAGTGAGADTRVSGDDTAVLLFALGRLPASDARLRVEGDADLAHRLKSYVPGP